MKMFLTIFLSVFLAELGDKTQLATMLFAADNRASQAMIFLAASAALIASTAIAVLLGAAAERYLSFLPLKLIAGFGFVSIGAYLVIEHFTKAA
ncbi:MAG TPA: TMEM165/GDT1 family protein [Parvularculaceae bacterium]|nr:TMEM165/GDT1 family protein [Parvularculaceae bacterium]